jgi:hypothetical protein
MAWAIIGGAAVMGGFGLLGSYIQGQAAEDAAATQSEAAQGGIDETKRQFDAMQALLKPYVEAGTQSLSAQQDLAGANGPEAQAAAVQAISSSPEMMALTQQGENALLQQGAATGGLRGGNVQGALAQFRPQVLSGLINQQYSRLGGLTQMGQASAAGVGAAGMQSGAQIADLLGQQGAAVAGGQLAAGQAAAAPFNQLSQLGGMYAMHGMGIF